MSATITVYTTSQCAFCVMVKKYLEAKGKVFSTINLDEQPDKREEVQALSGVSSVPITVIEKADGNKTVINGWNPSQLDAAIQEA